MKHNESIAEWILCISCDASGKFLDWIRQEISKYPFIKSHSIWDRKELLLRLEKHRDILEIFFYRVWKDLEQYFQTEELELIQLKLDKNGAWKEKDGKVLKFGQTTETSDLVFDVIVRNRGHLETLILSAIVEISDVQRNLRGIPGEGLLVSQTTYEISLHGGKSGKQECSFDPPLIVKAGSHERFKIRFKDTGFAWRGVLKLSLQYSSKKKELPLPAIYIMA